MVVHILTLWRVVLYNNFLVLEEHVLDLAHFSPGGRCRPFAVAGRHANVFPATAVAGDAEKRFSADVNLESAVTSVAGSAVYPKSKIPVAVFVQGVQIFHSASPIS